MNEITISGLVFEKPRFSHKAYKKDFYKFYIHSRRTSGVTDVIPCICTEGFVREFSPGKQVEILGEIRSRTIITEISREIMTYVMVDEVREYSGEDVNSVKIVGWVPRMPIYRKTPLGRDIASFPIISTRKFARRTDYIHCLAWGRNAIYSSKTFEGRNLELTGRLQSRDYIKYSEDEEEVLTVYEVSVSDFVILEEE